MNRDSPTPRRILVLRAGAIGDFVLTLPAMAALRAHGPPAALTLATLPRAGRLAVACGLADRTRSLDDAAFAPLFVEGAALAESLRAELAAHDLAVSFLHDPAGIVAAQLRRAGVRRVLAVAPPLAGEPLRDPAHAADRLLAPLEALGIPVTLPACPRLVISPALREAGRRLLPCDARRCVTLHPGSGSAAKNWPLENFVALADALAGGELCPVFVLGEAEEALRERLVRDGCRHAVLPECDLPELAGALAAVVVHVGNDSGITHLAAAVGVAAVALFGPTDPAQWGPRGERVQVLHARQGLGRLAVESVLAAVVRGQPNAAGVEPRPP